MSCEFKYPKELMVGDLVYKDWPMGFGISIVLEIINPPTGTNLFETKFLVLTSLNKIQSLIISNYKTIRCHVEI